MVALVFDVLSRPVISKFLEYKMFANLEDSFDECDRKRVGPVLFVLVSIAPHSINCVNKKCVGFCVIERLDLNLASSRVPSIFHGFLPS